MRKIFTRSPYYLTVKETYTTPETEIPQGGGTNEDGTPEPVEPTTPTDPTEPENPPVTLATTTGGFTCGNISFNFDSPRVTTLTKNYGELLYDIDFNWGVTWNGAGVRFEVIYNGSVVADTGYVGNSAHDQVLLDAGVSAGDINTVTTSSTVTGTLSYSKATASPGEVSIRVTNVAGTFSYFQADCTSVGETVTSTECYVLELVAPPTPYLADNYGHNILVNDNNIGIINTKQSLGRSFLYLFYDTSAYGGTPGITNTAQFGLNPYYSYNMETEAITNININAFNILKIAYSFYAAATDWQVTWWKGTLDLGSGIADNFCKVNTLRENGGFITGDYTPPTASASQIFLVNSTCL